MATTSTASTQPRGGAIATTPVPVGAAAILRCVLAVAGVLLFSTALDSYAFDVWSAPPPKYAIAAFVMAAAALVIVDPHRPMPLLRSPLLLWTYAYFAMTTAWAVWMSSSERLAQVLDDRYKSIALLIAFAVTFDEPRARRVGVLALAGAVVFNALLYVAELLRLVEFVDQRALGRVTGRAAGFFINPNSAGRAIVLSLAVAVFGVSRRWRSPLLLVAAMGVAATFSRGALVCLAALVLLLMFRKAVAPWSIALVCLLAGAILIHGSGIASGFIESRGILNENTWTRLRFEHDDSGRMDLAVKAWRMFADSPLIGNGLGATTDWVGASNSSHNQYLNLAADHGVLGLIALPALALALFIRDRRAFAISAVLLLMGMFTHNLFEDRSALLAIALAAAGTASPRAHRYALAAGDHAVTFRAG